ncbi:hypothetical protein TNCV_513421 [Trichonephila clavipes]|nr:hypothetical protein TNCV_513421 [Trichonephila clavipes]
MSDTEIIADVIVNEKKMLKNDEGIDDTIQNPKISHSEELKAIETALGYLKRQGALAVNLLFFRSLRDEAAKQSTEGIT